DPLQQSRAGSRWSAHENHPPPVFEFDFIPTHVFELRKKMLRSIRTGRIDAIVDEHALDQAFQSFVATIFQDRLKQSGRSVFCEKTPANALAFADLVKVFPDARHIMMVRDPRDVVNSMKSVRDKFIAKGERPPRLVRSVAASVQEINRYYQAGLSAAEQSEKVLLVYYEDLVSNPAQEIRRICDHTGLTYQPEMQNIEQQTFASSSVSDENWYSQDELRKPIQSSGVVSKTFSLSPTAVALVEHFTLEMPALARYGLHPRNPTLKETIWWYASLAQKAGLFLPRRRPV
ncbi:MAG: sulfotransferase, partial [Pseudomonadota bacterium]